MGEMLAGAAIMLIGVLIGAAVVSMKNQEKN